MHNYFTDQVILIDIILIFAIAFLSITIIIYALLKESLARRRNIGLINIKKNVYALHHSGAKLSANTCAPFTEGSTPQQFLDIETNRDSVFFNKDEQEIFKSCFTSPEKLKKIEKIAASSRNKWRRIEAMLILSYLDDESAPAICEKSLKSSNDDIRYFSMLALGQMKTGRSAEILVRLLKNDNFSRRKIVSMLELFPPDVTSSYAAGLLKDKKLEVRFWALKLLSRLNPKKHLNEILELFLDPADEVRAEVCECIGNSDNKTMADKLYIALKDKSWIVRSAAVKALPVLIGDACIRNVMELLKDSSLTVLSAVKEVLINHIDAAKPYMEHIFSGDDAMSKLICAEVIEEADRKNVKK